MSIVPETDPFLDAEVAEAMEPFRAKGLPEELLAEMASMLRLALAIDPKFQRLVGELRPRTPPKESGRVVIGDVLPPPAPQAAPERAAPPRKSKTRVR